MIDKNLLFLRKYHNMTQEELAEKISVSRQAVAKWESGETMPDLGKCVAIAELFSVTIDDLVRHDAVRKKVPIPPKGKHIFGTVVVGERGQIVIPKKAREIFVIKAGDELLILGDEEQRGLALIKSELFLETLHEMELLSKKKTDV